MNRLFRLSCLCALAGLLSFTPAQAAPIPVKITTHATSSMALCRSLVTMKNFIEEKTNGKYRVDIYDQFKLGTMESVKGAYTRFVISLPIYQARKPEAPKKNE